MEEERRLPEEDTITVLQGTQGSYPNFIFRIPESELEDFFSQLTNINDNESLRSMVELYGIRRTDPRIWTTLDQLHEYRDREEEKPWLLDINRYSNL